MDMQETCHRSTENARSFISFGGVVLRGVRFAKPEQPFFNSA